VFGLPFYCITQKQSKMVKIIGFQTKQNKEGEDFITLQLQGDITMVQSKETGRFYATAKECSITSTFTEEQAAALVEESCQAMW
jgi:hypothetical protein